jgi:hypothetical protein
LAQAPGVGDKYKCRGVNPKSGLCNWKLVFQYFGDPGLPIYSIAVCRDLILFMLAVLEWKTNRRQASSNDLERKIAILMDKRKRILLTSVFGPYALDDEFGSRLINPMSLYDNQVTRAQGPFSLHMFHGSWGLQMIQENINEPCTLLDFPTLETFRRELTRHRYDVVGISSIIPNVGKVKEMCRIIRELSPHSRIIVGGHVAALPELDQLIDADHIVRGEGIRWMREFLGEDVNAPIRHPHIISAIGMHMMGIKIPDSP